MADLSALLSLLVAAVPVQDYLPCEPGTTIVYRWEPVSAPPAPARELTRTDRVEGSEGRYCSIRRTAAASDGREGDVYVLERLSDRVLDAGWAGALTAFRSPLLRAPLEHGRRWRFNRVDYRVQVVPSIRTPAGVFRSVIQVTAQSIPAGEFHAVRTYARHVGLIEDRRSEGRWVAIRIRSPSKKRKKGR